MKTSEFHFLAKNKKNKIPKNKIPEVFYNQKKQRKKKHESRKSPIPYYKVIFEISRITFSDTLFRIS